MSKHTPGRWLVHVLSVPEFAIVSDQTRMSVARVYSGPDAALIAAAPEMLNALKEAAKFINRHGGGTSGLYGLRGLISATIKIAEGGE